MNVHVNLFGYYKNKTDVYKKLQEDYLRDQKKVKWILVEFILVFIAAIWVSSIVWKQVLFGFSIILLLQYLLLFIELSNRNYLMHAIDWLESNSN